MATPFKKIALASFLAFVVALPAAATELTVTVTTDGVTPVADGTVLYAHNDDYSSFAWETTTTGVATFDLADDDYSIAVHMVPGEESAISGLPAAQSVTLPDTTTLDVELVAAQNTVTGRVLDTTGGGLQTDYAVWGVHGESLATGTTSSNGSFTVQVPAGEYMMTFDAADTTTTFDPVWFDFASNAGEAIDLGSLTATAVESELETTSGVGTISGVVSDTEDTALNCQSVVGVQTNGDGWFYATTNVSGEWSASVAAGDWLVQGLPTGIDVCEDGVELGSLFVSSNGPIADIVQPLATGTARAQLTAPQEVTLEDGETKTANFTLTTADATLSGYVRFASSHENAGDVARDFHGIVIATADDNGHLYQNSVWGWVRAGRFSLDVPGSPSGGYTLQAVNVPLGGAYNAVAAGQYTDDTISENAIDIASAETVNDAAVYVLPNDGAIEGQIRNWPSGQNISARICATNRHDTHVCTVTRESSYELPVAAGVWSLNVILPSNTHVVSSTPLTQRVTVAAGESESLPITLSETNATLTGTVKAPSGTALSDAAVTIIGEDGQLVTDRTDDSGRFSVALPAGYYAVHAQPGGDSAYGETDFAQVRVNANETETLTLTTTTLATTTSDVVATMPEPQVRLVPANAHTQLSMSNGFTLGMPAYSLLPNQDSMTVRVSPVDELPESSVYPLVSHGYDIDVRKEDGTQLPAFADVLSISVPYNGEDIAALGWSESELTLAVYRNGAWEPLPGAIVHTTANTVSAQLQNVGTVAIVGSPLLVLTDLDFSRPDIDNLRVPIENRGDTWARAEWASVLDDKTVELQVWNVDQDELITTARVSSGVTEKVLTGLTSNKKYSVRGRTSTNYGNSDWSDWVAFRTRPKNPESLRTAQASVRRKGHGTAIVRFSQPKKRSHLQAQVRLIGAKRNRQLRFKACPVKKRQKRCQKKRYKKGHAVTLQRSRSAQRIRIVIPKKHAHKRLKVSVRSRHKRFTQHTSQFVRTSTFRLEE